MTKWIPLLALLVLVGCRSNRDLQSHAAGPPPPSWVENRPTSGTHYIGIGVAPKLPGTDFRRVARENAMSDLAGDIQVEVNTRSLLHTLETNDRFEQEFRESIRTQSNLELREYEMVDSWEDANYHWVFYRLDKSRWAAIKAERRTAAQSLALDFLAKAEAEIHRRQFSTAVDYYLRGLQAIKEFQNEPIEVEYRGKSILLGNELYGGLTDLITRTVPAVESAPPLQFSTGYQSVVEIRVAKDGVPMEGVPLKTSYSGTYGSIRGKYDTNADGRVEVEITDADRSGKANVFIAEIDMEALTQPFGNDKFMKALTASLAANSVRETIQYHPPQILIRENERNLGKRFTTGPIAAAVKTSLSRKGVSQTTDSNSADIVVDIDANTAKNGTSQSFKVSVLHVTITVLDGKSGREIFQTSKSDIKGLGITYEEAGLAAIENYTKNIESQLMRQLTTTVF